MTCKTHWNHPELLDQFLKIAPAAEIETEMVEMDRLIHRFAEKCPTTVDRLNDMLGHAIATFTHRFGRTPDLTPF